MLDTFVTTFAFMVFAHFLADFPLQGDFMAMAKNRHTAQGKDIWRWVLSGHSIIHGGFVMLISGSLTLGIIETVIHYQIDKAKCNDELTFSQDQNIHIWCKAAYASILAFWWC